MRRDMDKVLCERPRQGARFERRSRYRGPLENAPSFESTSRNRGGCKSLNEHLGPLRRWLRAQVGRPWSAVYSELRANISPKNAVQMHIWQHAQQYVAQHVELVDGKPRYRNHAAFRYPFLVARWTPVYVCPKTGILRLTPPTPRKRKGPGRN
jgi:hypothetical protein